MQQHRHARHLPESVPDRVLAIAAALVDLLGAIVLIGLVAVLVFALTPQAAHAADPAPTCTPWTTGKGVTYGKVTNTVGVAWWCPPLTTYGNWQPHKAAIFLPDDPAESQKYVAALDARDTAALLAMRSVPLADPGLVPLWGSMEDKHRRAKPLGPWFVAPNGTAAYRTAYDITGTTVRERKDEKIPVGTPCNCASFRLVVGTSTYCEAGGSNAVCKRKAP